MPRRKPKIYWETSTLEPQPQQPTGKTPHIYFEQPDPAPAPLQDPTAVILGLDTDTKHPISVSQADLCEGTYIEGVQGTGKTSLLEQVVYQQTEQDEAIIVLDPHGDLVNSIIAHMPAHRLSKTYLLDLKDRAYPFGLNAFTCRNPNDEEDRDTTRSQIMHAFAKLWPEIEEGQYFKRYLPHVIITLIENPTLTLANVERLLDDDAYRQRYTGRLKNSETRSFWLRYASLPQSKRMTETSPLRGRLGQLLTEPVINAILRQTKKTVNIRELIEEKAILLVKLPVNVEAYKYSSPVIGTFLMSMIYAATFSFDDIPNLDDRPGFTLIVDEFQNFATDEYAKLFEQGRKYKVKQFLAHQHRQQLERGSTGKTNLAATLSANTIIAFRTIPDDARAVASLYTGIAEKRRPTDIFIHPLEKIDNYPHPLVKQFVLDVVDKLDEASGGKIRVIRGERIGRRYFPGEVSYPGFDFGAGRVNYKPQQIEEAISLLDRLIYKSEEQGATIDPLKQAFLKAVTPLWKLQSDKDEEKAEARARHTYFVRQLDSVLALLIQKPIANDAKVTSSGVASLLEDLEKRHAFIKTGSTAYAMETRDTRLLQAPTTAQEAAQRLRQVKEQTRSRYCVHRSELEEHEEAVGQREEEEEQLPPQPEPVQIETQEPEPIEVVFEPEIQLPEPPAHKEPKQPLPSSMDTMNVLYTQLRAREIDPDTTILASLGEHYVLTIKQWMRLFERKAYPKATPYFNELREQGWIYRKDREGRGGKLVEGDWFFLLTKGANELLRRKQPSPLFKLEPNEAERASGDTLFHTYLVNEVLIHLRLLERSHPDLLKIEGIDHERSMRRNYLAALGSDTKLYPDGFIRLLVPTPNGLKKRYLFLELQHTTQKDKHNFQTKVRKYTDLFDRADILAKFFRTRTPRVLVLTMDEEYAKHHKQWTEEVLAERGDNGRGYGNRFLIGAYDTGITDMTMPPQQFFCTPRFFAPFRDAAFPVFDS